MHLPFCPYVCPYCDFAKWPLRESSARAYLEALRAEVANAAPFVARTLFFGGGTPNTYDAATLAELVRPLRDRFAPLGFAETTIEMNPDPDLCTPATFAAYRAAGIDRVSFGVQSFVPSELATLGRRHSPADVERAFSTARAAGIENLSLDLIFGTPGQSDRSWRASLAAAVALEPEHVSTYGLTIEDDTPFAAWYARRPADFATNDLEGDLYASAIDVLTAAGFEHYEISNFARPGRRCAHNENYWANGEYLGLGVGAASYLGGTRSTHTRELERYVAAAGAGAAIPGDAEHLSGPARLGEAAMLALRTAEGVDVGAFAERYGVDFHEFYGPVLTEMRATGTIDATPTHVRLTRRGRFVANDVCGRVRRVRGSVAMSKTILRVLFMLVFAVAGFLLGREAYTHLISLHVASQGWLIALTIGVPTLGAVLGLFVAPIAQSIFEVELDSVEATIERLAPGEAAGGAIGLIVGLVIAFLVKSVLFEFIANAGRSGQYVATVAYIVLSAFAAYLGARVGAKQRIGAGGAPARGGAPLAVQKLIDTSVIVDGRVIEIVESGFLEGPLVLPRFVLQELQLIADSADPLKRTRGRRGLDVLAKLQELTKLDIADVDYHDLSGVDAKLVRMAKDRHAKLVTNDYNLNRVAHVEGVEVLNVNELAGAVKPVVLPGEELHVTIVRDGKEAHQGVGYLDDGTMIVVENGRRLVGEDTDVQV